MEVDLPKTMQIKGKNNHFTENKYFVDGMVWKLIFEIFSDFGRKSNVRKMIKILSVKSFKCGMIFRLFGLVLN